MFVACLICSFVYLYAKFSLVSLSVGSIVFFLFLCFSVSFHMFIYLFIGLYVCLYE